MSSVSQVIAAFELLYAGLRNREFRKSLPLHEWSERQLLPLVRTFLLGYFGPKARPEHSTVLPNGLSGMGRIDFLVYGVAVEFAVRRPYYPKSDLLPKKNKTEILKLMTHPGRGVLVLFDFSKDALSSDELGSYRQVWSLVQEEHPRSAFSIAYFSLANDPVRLNVRV